MKLLFGYQFKNSRRGVGLTMKGSVLVRGLGHLSCFSGKEIRLNEIPGVVVVEEGLAGTDKFEILTIKTFVIADVFEVIYW